MTASQPPGDPRGEERTQVCDQCGTRQGSEHTFCESCNAVLGWSAGTSAPAPSGQGAPTPSAPAPSAPAPAAPAPSGQSPSWQAPHGQAPYGQEPFGQSPSGQSPFGQSAQAAAPGAPAAPGASGTWDTGREEDDTLETPPVPASGSAPGTVPAQPGPDQAGDWSGARPPEPDAASDAERARALLVPVADPRAQPDRPPTVAPVLPGRPAPARPEVRSLGEQDIQGGVACPWCSTANSPERHFCSRCAMSMATRPGNEARRPWWRRMLDYRNREEPWAGDRPRLGWRLGRILRWVVWAAVAALAVTGLFHVGDGISAARDHFAKRASVAPDSSSASHSYPHHGPGLAFDKVSNTWWGPGINESGGGEWLEAHFRDPVTLLNIGITAGESTHADTLSKSALPHRVQARITEDSGKVTTKELILDQSAGFQSRSFRFHNVTSVRFILETAYNAGPKKQVAIAEIEFFGPSQGDGS
ncbi:zinc ribbon domain-containing protein [Streptomyces sp. NBC_01267]|uniref:NADase-type glycan-binding domain-containing protein n=1 Tax=unclassified Streptomyces TaxID=2593676 RepID=UPI002024A271|nr:MULTISPECIES: zinc ribbon domain-containing protein [unclassified Streptomyces]MCX4549377.1 zinc ribbon domain-containing protein [Streptomyces sp. NBC_01500]WSV54921.1 zinc ribbon domain-containing protein [Streptomyces sp. NBC_01014]